MILMVMIEDVLLSEYLMVRKDLIVKVDPFFYLV